MCEFFNCYLSPLCITCSELFLLVLVADWGLEAYLRLELYVGVACFCSFCPWLTISSLNWNIKSLSSSLLFWICEFSGVTAVKPLLLCWRSWWSHASNSLMWFKVAGACRIWLWIMRILFWSYKLSDSSVPFMRKRANYLIFSSSSMSSEKLHGGSNTSFWGAGWFYFAYFLLLLSSNTRLLMFL